MVAMGEPSKEPDKQGISDWLFFAALIAFVAFSALMLVIKGHSLYVFVSDGVRETPTIPCPTSVSNTPISDPETNPGDC